MKILVTGATGQLGLALKRVLEAEIPGKTVYYDRQTLDITDSGTVEKVFAEGNYTHVINAAAYTAVDKAEEEKGQCTAVNVEGVKNLAKAAEASGAKMIHISTDYVFDGSRGCPYTEADKPNPLSHYGASKRKGEMALVGLMPESIIIRTGWLFSPFGKNFVKTIFEKAKKGDSLKVVSDQIGTPTSAFDLARMIYKIISSPKWIPGTYHFSNEGVASWYDLAVSITEIAGLDSKIKPITTVDYPAPASRPGFSVLDKSLIKATYSVSIPYWRDALKEVITILNEGGDSNNEYNKQTI